MKKKFFIYSVLLCIFISSGFSESVYDYDIDEVYRGTYIPGAFYNYFESTLNYENAKYRPFNGYHDVLFLYENTCRSDAKFHDSYAIKKSDFDEFRFVTNESGTYLIDNNGFIYKKISNEPGYELYEKYVFDYVVSCIKDLNNVVISKDSFFIDGKEFRIEYDSTFLTGDDVAIWLRSEGKFYGIKINGISATIYESNNEFPFVSITDKVFCEIPVFSYKPLIPFEKLSKEDLRVYRNLQYARHGHKFKSEDLQQIFGKFDWYEPVTDNAESLLTWKEKEIVKQAQIYEKKS